MNMIKFTFIIATALLISCNKTAIDDNQKLHVYKTPTCGCCSKWVQYMQDNGYNTSFTNQNDVSPLKDSLDIPNQYRSCHTGTVTKNNQTYFFEGHIPAYVVDRFLQSPPQNAIGLTVPGMPVGSPGMEFENKTMAYKVFIVYKGGNIQVYENIDG